MLCYTNGSTISGNVVTDNLNGITLERSSDNVISDNRVAGNSKYGIYLDGGSRDNNVSDNRIESNGKDGVSVYAIGSSKGNLVSQNQISSNQGNGISVNGAQDWKIVGNNITLNRVSGICFLYGSRGNAVNENYIARNGMGVQLSDAVENIITLNTIIENNGWAIRLNGSQGNNVIHHNNFIDNHVKEGLQVSMPATWSFHALSPDDFANFSAPKMPSPLKEPTLGAANSNVWDDGKEGNYWSDYALRYPNASEIGNTGVGDTPYYINENNVDRHPLMAPCDTSTADSPLTSPSQEHESKTEPFPTTLVATTSVASIGVCLGLLVYFKKRKG